MTRQRYDKQSTEFGLWLREQKEIDSSQGYCTTNIDYLWTNYKTKEWMLIEEKRYGVQVKFPQKSLFKLINSVCKIDKNYKGFHLIVFENTNPEDGKIYLDNRMITKEELINFLKFKLNTIK